MRLEKDWARLWEPCVCAVVRDLALWVQQGSLSRNGALPNVEKQEEILLKRTIEETDTTNSPNEKWGRPVLRQGQ